MVLPPDEGYKPKGWLDIFKSFIPFKVFDHDMNRTHKQRMCRSMFYQLDMLSKSASHEPQSAILGSYANAREYLEPIYKFFRSKNGFRVS